jgi:PAP2 superfamily protein
MRGGDLRRALRRWPVERHSLAVEASTVVLLYAVYELTRGLVAGDRAVAVHHARVIASLERSLHVFREGQVQDAAQVVPGLLGTLGVLYLTLHLAVSAAYLLWLHRRRPSDFPLVRTALGVVSALALVGYLAYPTAPPRLATLGIADTISGGDVDLNHGLISSLYNPFAAVPSMHIGYAVVVGATLFRYGRRPSLRLAGVAYPLLQLLVIVATGNHFFFDAAAGAAVSVVALSTAAVICRQRVSRTAGHVAAVRVATPAAGSLDR